MGVAIAEECKDQHVGTVLGPGVNMKRSALCGRNFEYFSEDPFLAGQLGIKYVQGVQSKGVGTSLKHFAVNNQEYLRMTISAVIDERALHEIYLRAFEDIVKAAQPKTIMCSYNKINGVYSSDNKMLLSDILREKWGYQGLVVSDWGATNDRVAGIKAGMDLEMHTLGLSMTIAS
jgi:beta-glucosidase